MKIIGTGNFLSWFRLIIWASGIVVVASSYRFLPGRSMFLGVVIGMVVASVDCGERQFARRGIRRDGECERLAGQG